MLKKIRLYINRLIDLKTVVKKKYSTIYMTLKSFKLQNGFLIIKLDYYDTKIITSALLKSRSMQCDKEYRFPITKRVKKNKTVIEFRFEIKNIDWEEFYWDLYIEDNHRNLIRIQTPNFITSVMISRTKKFNYKLKNKVVYPFFHEGKSLSFIYREEDKYETIKYRINEIMARLLFITFSWFFYFQNYWLVFEKMSGFAQDNAYYFFKYCLDNKKKKKIFFLIKKDSTDANKMRKYKKNVVYFMSIKHLLLIQACKLIISSEAKGHGYIWRSSKGIYSRILNQKKQVFLQHGVLGLKKIGDSFISSTSSANRVELFVASTEYERLLIMNDFGYRSTEVVLSGLPRWDYLIDKSNNYHEILCIPTFRNWLEEVDETQFENSNYYKEYQSLLNSKELELFLEHNDFTFIFCTHPKNNNYIHLFNTNNKRIKIVSSNSIQINELIMRASLLITDYSSIAWDMFYLNKPILFYQFDLEDYINYQGSYMDLKRDLFADAVYNKLELFKWLRTNVYRRFKTNSIINIGTFDIKHRNSCNSERVYLEIQKRRKELQSDILLTKIKQNEFFYEAWRVIQVVRRRLK